MSETQYKIRKSEWDFFANGLLKVGVTYQNGARMNARTLLAKTMPKQLFGYWLSLSSSLWGLTDINRKEVVSKNDLWNNELFTIRPEMCIQKVNSDFILTLKQRKHNSYVM